MKIEADKDLVSLILISLFLLTSGCTSPRRVDYELKIGFTGWVKVKFNVADCQSTRRIFGGEVIEINDSGIGCSEMKKPTTTIGSTYYVDAKGERVEELRSSGWGEGGMLWAKTASESDSSIEFFVGTEAQLEESWGQRNKPRGQ